ncbi:hypothetical protein D9M71_461460 [compost metagenome]
MLAQRAEQQVQLGRTDALQGFGGRTLPQDSQALRVGAEGAVDQVGVQTAQVAQRVREMEGRIQAEQQHAVALRRTEIEQQRALPGLLDRQGEMRGEQRRIAILLPAVERRHAAVIATRRRTRQTPGQAPGQAGDLAGTRAIGEEVPGPSAHGIEHQLVVHAVAQRHHHQQRAGLQNPLDQGGLGQHIVAVEADEKQSGAGYVDQCDQFVQRATTGLEHLPQRRQRILQPVQVGAVAGQGEEGLADRRAHWDNPARRSKLPFSRKNSSKKFGS